MRSAVSIWDVLLASKIDLHCFLLDLKISLCPVSFVPREERRYLLPRALVALSQHPLEVKMARRLMGSSRQSRSTDCVSLIAAPM